MAARTGKLIASEARFPVRIRLDSPPEPLRETRGHVVIEGERRSVLAGWLGSALSVLVRESGFQKKSGILPACLVPFLQLRQGTILRVRHVAYTALSGLI